MSAGPTSEVMFASSTVLSNRIVVSFTRDNGGLGVGAMGGEGDFLVGYVVLFLRRFVGYLTGINGLHLVVATNRRRSASVTISGRVTYCTDTFFNVGQRRFSITIRDS